MKAEERKVLKEKLKKQIDELTDEELENVAGGAAMCDPGFLKEMRFMFTPEDVEILKQNGFYDVLPNQLYTTSALKEMGICFTRSADILHPSNDVVNALKRMGIEVIYVEKK